MADAITAIETAIVDAIEGMTKAGGYYYDWNSGTQVNAVDLNTVTQWPAVMVNITEEENLDGETSSDNTAYHNRLLFELIVHVDNNGVPQDHPIIEIRARWNKAIADLKKLFGTNYNLGGLCDRIMYQGHDRVPQDWRDAIVPGQITTRWECTYVQGRTNPDVLG